MHVSGKPETFYERLAMLTSLFLSLTSAIFCALRKRLGLRGGYYITNPV